MNIKTLSIKCPNCSKQVIMNDESPFRPFCSERCQSLDLGDWAFENHKIPGDIVEDEDQWSEDLHK